MRNYLIIATLILFGCGGSSFTALEVGETGSDDAASQDASDSASRMEHDSGASMETGRIDSNAADSGSDGSDVGVCTPFDGGTVGMGMLCGGQATQATYQVPAQIILDQQGCLTPFPTPLACQCAETYTCACIGNPTACGSPGCTVRDGVVVISCN